MTLLDTTLLVDLIGRKFDCLNQLRALGERQHQLVESGDMASLLNLLAAKQRSVDLLHELDRALDPFRREDPDRRRWTSEAERLRCASLAEQSARLLAEVLEGEQRCADVLSRRRDETAEQLAIVHSSHQTRSAYHFDAGASSASTLDLTSDS